MVKVECDGCQSPYQIDEKRIPATGLKMRCPKCGKSLVVMRPGDAAAAVAPVDADLPAAAAPRAGPPGAPRPPPRPAAKPPAVPPAVPVAPLAVDALEEVSFELDAELPVARPAAARGGASLLARPAPAPARNAAAHTRGFGELDLLVDFPAPQDPAPAPAAWSPPGGDDVSDLPELQADDLPVIGGRRDQPAAPAAAPVPQAPPATPARAPEPPARSPRSGELGEVELPVVHGHGVVRRPVRNATVAGGFGEIDLPIPSVSPPAPWGAPAAAQAGALPADHAEGRGGFGEIDLPIVGGGAELPATQSVGLPAAGSGAGLPARAAAGLPAVGGASLPAVGGGAGLPAVGTGGLPAVGGAGLPSYGTGGLPAVGGPGLPSFGAGGLPSAASAVGMPQRAGVGLPSLGAGSVVGAELYGDDLAPHEPNAGSAFTRRQPKQVPDSIDVGEEFSLDDEPESKSPRSDRGARRAATDADAVGIELGEGDGSPAMGGVGDEVELGGAPAGDIASVARKEPRHAAADAPPAKRSHALKYVLAGLVVASIAGGALALVPALGPFGYHFITDRLNAGTHEQALLDLRAAAQKSLDADTAPAAATALQTAKTALRNAERHRPTAAYVAYVASMKGLRFGKNGSEDAYAKQLVESGKDHPGETSTLATAALDAANGQLARARLGVGPLAANDIDAAVLAGEIELVAKDSKTAVPAWKRAVELQKSARTLFGLARAELAAGDPLAAEASAKAVLQASKNHVGARTLLASVAWQDAARESETLGHLTKVTEDPEIRKAASEAELVDAYTLLGRVHLARSRMTAAEQAFAAALKLDPQAVQALLGNGELFYRAGRYSEALARFEAAIRADADMIVGKVGTAKTWIALERMKEAKELLKKLREAHPKEPLVAYWFGRAEEALGNKKEAEAAYVEAIKIGDKKPEVVDAYVALAQLMTGRGALEDAAAKLGEAGEKFPDSAALHKAKGEVYLQTGRYAEARKELEAALAQEEDLGTKFRLGIAHRRMREFEAAAEIFDSVATVDKEYPGLALERGLLFEATGQIERSGEMYAEALRKAPNDIDLKLRVGSTQVMAGHAKQAEPMLREVMRERPNSAEANHFLGRALLVKNTNLAEALRFLERAVEIDSNRAEYFLYVGWGANEAGQPARAADALRRALELDKDLADAYWQRGVLLQKQGATLDALADLKIALEKRPSRYQAYATMGLCLQDLSKWAEAEDAWRKAIAGDDTVPEWHYRLGKIYSQRGNRAGAATELEKATTLAEAPERSQPNWLFDAHLHLAEAMKAANNRPKTIHHYRRFLATAPSDNAYRADAQAALEALGASKDR